MSISTSIAAALKQLVGHAGPDVATVTLDAPQQVEVAMDFRAVDAMSCSLAELRVNVPHLIDAEVGTLKQWADALCGRVTYLMENISALELDKNDRQVLIRSDPPSARDQQTRYYEIMLTAQEGGNFALRRYLAEKGQPGRQQVDIQITHELLEKLGEDLIDTIPAA